MMRLRSIWRHLRRRATVVAILVDGGHWSPKHRTRPMARRFTWHSVTSIEAFEHPWTGRKSRRSGLILCRLLMTDQLARRPRLRVRRRTAPQAHAATDVRAPRSRPQEIRWSEFPEPALSAVSASALPL